MKRELYRTDLSTYTPVAKYSGVSVNLTVKRVLPPIINLKEALMWNIATLGSVKAYCLYNTDNKLVHRSFVTKSKAKFPFLHYNDIHIGPCWTDKLYRGRGYYPFVISKIIASELTGGGVAYMIVNDENIPSLRGIIKVGFKKTGYLVIKDFFKRQILVKDEE